MPARQRISALRNQLHDIASELQGEAMKQGLARADIERAAEQASNSMSALTDALTHKLGD